MARRGIDAAPGSGDPAGRDTPAPAPPQVVDCAVYRDGRRLAGRWTPQQAADEVRGCGGGFVWIGLHDPRAEYVNGLAQTFDLHELAVEDAVHAHQRPKLDRYDDMLFMVLKTIRYVEHESPTTANEIVETGEVMIFLGADFVVTVRHGNHSELRGIRAGLEARPDRLASGPAAVLHAIADSIVDGYLDVVDAVEEDIDQLESAVFETHSHVEAEHLYLMKREVLEMRRAVLPLATPLRRLADGDTPLVPPDVRSYFRDVEDHLTTVAERVGGFDELMTTLVDTVQAKITLRQNNDMRKITAWAAILAVPTMVAGIYGMNFTHMPELNWTFGYPGVLTLIAAVCLVLYRTFRRNKWL